ncbi:MAG: hypothetical protein HQ517_03580 [SAR324 cluster bacterium]|nr:hypothetical protein [SAR324 cluster bacterium]
MKTRIHRIYLTALAVILLLVFGAPSAFSGEVIKVTGKLNADFEFVADNSETYEIAEDEKGEALADFMGKTVEIVGRVDNQEGIIVLTVISFREL